MKKMYCISHHFDEITEVNVIRETKHKVVLEGNITDFKISNYKSIHNTKAEAIAFSKEKLISEIERYEMINNKLRQRIQKLENL